MVITLIPRLRDDTSITVTDQPDHWLCAGGDGWPRWVEDKAAHPPARYKGTTVPAAVVVEVDSSLVVPEAAAFHDQEILVRLAGSPAVLVGPLHHRLEMDDLEPEAVEVDLAVGDGSAALGTGRGATGPRFHFLEGADPVPGPSVSLCLRAAGWSFSPLGGVTGLRNRSRAVFRQLLGARIGLLASGIGRGGRLHGCLAVSPGDRLLSLRPSGCHPEQEQRYCGHEHPFHCIPLSRGPGLGGGLSAGPTRTMLAVRGKEHIPHLGDSSLEVSTRCDSRCVGAWG